MAEAGYGKRFTDAADVKEFALMQKLEKNIAQFTGGKLNAFTDELRRKLYKDGKKLSEEEWTAKAKSVSRRHLVTWRKTEERTMAQTASAARHWAEIERRAYLYPNLKYVTAHDELVRDSHRILDGAIYPVSDPFWDTHYPPNGWNCRCIVVQTDQKAKPGKGKGDIKISKGMDNNAGKTGLLISEDHPYFNLDDLDREKIYKQAEKLHFGISKKIASAAYHSGSIHEFKFPNGNIVEVMYNSHFNHIITYAHSNRPARNNLLINLQKLLSIADFVKEADDQILTNGKQKHPWVKKWYYYLIELNGEKYYLNVFLHTDTNKLGLYAITKTLYNV